MDQLAGFKNPFTPFHDLATKYHAEKTLRDQFEQMLADKKDEMFEEFKAKVAKTYPKLKEGARVSVDMGWGKKNVYLLCRISGDELVWINTVNGNRFSEPFRGTQNPLDEFVNWTANLITTEGTI